MINSVYDYYLSTYAGRQVTKYDTHKKSELRNVYNSIVNISKKSPLYKLNASEDIQKFAIDLKESARDIKTISKTFDATFDSEKDLSNKKVYSSDENLLSVNYIGDDANADSDTTFDISIDKLATPQINTGAYLGSGECRLSNGAFSFDCRIDGSTYEFQFNVNEGENNLDVQSKLARLFNKSGVGLEANIITSQTGNTALEIRSVATGLVEFSGDTFSISANDTPGSSSVVSYFGLDNITSLPENASFTINGDLKTSVSNTFTVNKAFEITLKDITTEGDDPVHIGFKEDMDNLIDSTKTLVGGFNNILTLAKDKADDSFESSRLLKELSSIVKHHQSDLESSGIRIDEDGILDIDKALITQVANEDGIKSVFDKLQSFKQDMTHRADNIAINPMHYVNKTLISYPNPNKTFANPYVTSIYSGMMFNGYV